MRQSYNRGRIGAAHLRLFAVVVEGTAGVGPERDDAPRIPDPDCMPTVYAERPGGTLTPRRARLSSRPAVVLRGAT
jgi:hypothetical protein